MENYFLFVLMCIFLIILPGPDTAIVTKNTLFSRRIGGLKTSLGIICALLFHTFAAVVGLSAIIVKSAILFSIFKYAGAIYLIYLGMKILWSLIKKDDAPTVEMNTKHQSENRSCFKQGFLTDLLNPKVAIFFLSFFPQFVEPGGDTFFPFLLMGITFTVLSAIWLFIYVYLINVISAIMKKPLAKNLIEGITGTIIIGFGIKLALEKANN
ncbi:LysE family translocator [Lysinibacillus endophyticus]|uniref:LysE family translocator n=1 Tax=Ureibacillus endophyticus TaxID=1978490 RepID=A0A494YY16_9BACL|nr:LysE family translocator [Lysinibacillus endophyticus]MCP1144830.1 LysE family translocator [Lysinibacillus endophyticus]RKQ15080.1 LysE family translocator [Lysinibacillus endophyticus]